ncbi:ribosome maturation factor RimM [Saccharicrinis aurantiacus]|uniref:ribosome maturation factor RimM n=1 Tax=Saccharicrinis aurantiacus TaxID=1849719 RepID=UPI00094F828A|nr:ribosome maturation factor RimM [Saccharicrinis aurantiacus]
MINKTDCTKIGVLAKPHGVKGEISISLEEGIYAGDFESEFLLLDIEDGLVPFYIESIRDKSNKYVLVKLADVDTEDKVRKLAETDIYVLTTEMLINEEKPSAALVGFTVNDAVKGNVGVISGVQEITNNPLFEIDADGNEVLIPINPDFILSIDEDNKIINMDLPEGLIDVFLDEDEEDIDFEIPEE